MTVGADANYRRRTQAGRRMRKSAMNLPMAGTVCAWPRLLEQSKHGAAMTVTVLLPVGHPRCGGASHWSRRAQLPVKVGDGTYSLVSSACGNNARCIVFSS